uniref:Aminopeptidase n=1 Tax=Fundulus heteroclitus TaxID=8078 RepID=A0A3Q2PAI7_FUNHE
MGKGFYISKALALACLFAAVGVLATIVALSVMYAQERSKNLHTASTTPPGPKEPWDYYRLPESLSPVRYNITLWPRLKPNPDDLYIFTGHSRVAFRCVSKTSLILIHSSKLKFKMFDGFHAVLTGLDGAVAPALRETWLEVATQYLVITLNAPLQLGSMYELYTEFEGNLSDGLEGFYKSQYVEDGVKKVIATTQMQPTEARKAFPCFDEPAMKAVFHMTLIHPHGTVALSNAMNYGKSPTFCNLIQTCFEPTEIMSTYLLAFIVCDFAYIRTNRDADVLVRIWARRKAIEEGQGNYALEKTGSILAFFQNYYNSSYPLRKSDQVAIPDFSNGAMENWGLITYRETSLLYNPGVSSNRDKESVTTTISHELAHMWFGNLVTMKWWNDVWLNEGFATYVSYLGADYAEPDWNMKDLIVLNDITHAMTRDASVNSHPLSSKEEDIQRPDQIYELFDTITYSKGAAVLRMLSEFITETVFSQGLHVSIYNKRDKYNSFHYCAVDKAGISLPHSVEVLMNRWILQMGFPVITIDTQTGNIAQEQFLLDPQSVVDRPSEFNYEWFVPITWIKSGASEQQYWLLNKEATNTELVIGAADWLVANINMKGFYRVNYDEENWDRLIAKLSSNHQDIPVINRAQIIDDAFNLAMATKVNITLALRTTTFLNKDVEFLPWAMASRNLYNFFLMFDRSEVYGPMQAYIRKQITPLFHYFKDLTLNWTKIPEKHTDRYNQLNTISLACRAGVEGCRELTSGWFKEWMNNPAVNKISAHLKSVVYCNAIAAGGIAEWDFALKMSKNATITSEADRLRHALSCTMEPWLLNRYLQYCLDPGKIRKQDAYEIFVSIARNPIGQPLVWDFLFIEEVEAQYGHGAFGLEHFLERTETNMNWMALNKKPVSDWLISQTSEI